MKVRSSIYIDGSLRELADKLGINISQSTEEILKLKIAAKFQSLETDIKSLESLGARYFAEEKKNGESIELVKQQTEFEEWKVKRLELIENENQRIALKIFHDTCETHSISPLKLRAFIVGDSSDVYRGPELEKEIMKKMLELGLPDDLNILRPALYKNVVRR